MSTLKLSGGDLELSATGSLVLLRDDVVAETAQRLTTKLRTFLGEWFLDERIGMPYYESVLIKNPELQRIRFAFREMILSDEQVDSLETPIELELNSSTREMTLTFAALLNTGEILEFAEAILEEYL